MFDGRELCRFAERVNPPIQGIRNRESQVMTAAWFSDPANGGLFQHAGVSSMRAGEMLQRPAGLGGEDDLGNLVLRGKLFLRPEIWWETVATETKNKSPPIGGVSIAGSIQPVIGVTAAMDLL